MEKIDNSRSVIFAEADKSEAKVRPRGAHVDFDRARSARNADGGRVIIFFGYRRLSLSLSFSVGFR